jgi:hypothetical protein
MVGGLSLAAMLSNVNLSRDRAVGIRKSCEKGLPQDS